MLEDVRDGRRLEPIVDAVEHRARHRHAKVRFQHRRRVRQHGRDGVARRHATSDERRGQLARPRPECRIGRAHVAVDPGDALGVDVTRAFDEADRGERRMIRRIAVETHLVRAVRGMDDQSHERTSRHWRRHNSQSPRRRESQLAPSLGPVASPCQRRACGGSRSSPLTLLVARTILRRCRPAPRSGGIRSRLGEGTRVKVPVEARAHLADRPRRRCGTRSSPKAMAPSMRPSFPVGRRRLLPPAQEPSTQPRRAVRRTIPASSGATVMGSLSLTHWLVVLAIVLLLFGAGRIPHAMSDLARGIRALRSGMRNDNSEADGEKLVEASSADQRPG